MSASASSSGPATRGQSPHVPLCGSRSQSLHDTFGASSTDKIIVHHVRGDLFDSQDSLVHCVSRDLNMGKGIAKDFKTRFGRVAELHIQMPNIGSVVYLDDFVDADVDKQRFILLRFLFLDP